MHINQDLYGFRCDCEEHDRKNFYMYETEQKIKCLTCGVSYAKGKKGKYERIESDLQMTSKKAIEVIKSNYPRTLYAT